MQLYLDDFAASLPIDVVALLVLDGASWHRSPKLTVPDSLRLMFPAALYARPQPR
jgi:hypothetical protein